MLRFAIIALAALQFFAVEYISINNYFDGAYRETIRSISSMFFEVSFLGVVLSTLLIYFEKQKEHDAREILSEDMSERRVLAIIPLLRSLPNLAFLAAEAVENIEGARIEDGDIIVLDTNLEIPEVTLELQESKKIILDIANLYGYTLTKQERLELAMTTTTIYECIMKIEQASRELRDSFGSQDEIIFALGHIAEAVDLAIQGYELVGLSVDGEDEELGTMPDNLKRLEDSLRLLE